MALSRVSGRASRLALLPALALLGLTTFSSAPGFMRIQAQTQPNATPSAPLNSAQPVPKRAVQSKHGRVLKPSTQPETIPVVPATVVTPPPPNWPVNDKAAPASVDWNGRILSISAANSSLRQILSDVSTATGVKVEGTPGDQRVYGSYGPASARDVLTQLLDGSGYNVLMVGDQGEGTPRTLVLTTRSNLPASNGGPNVLARQGTDEEAPEDPEPAEQADPAQRHPPGFQPGANRSPQQIMQEMEQRRQQMQQQQQQQPQQPQQGAPVQPPVPPVQPQDH